LKRQMSPRISWSCYGLFRYVILYLVDCVAGNRMTIAKSFSGLNLVSRKDDYARYDFLMSV